VQIGKAERAAATVPQERRSGRLRALMQRLERRKADLLRARSLLRANLAVVESYRNAATDLAGARGQLGLLNDARTSLGALPGTTRGQMTRVLSALERQAAELSQEEQTHQSTEESLRTPARQATSKPLPGLPVDVGPLVDKVTEVVEGSRPPAPTPGPSRPGGDAPRSNRPPSPPHSPPGKPRQTTAPPHPSSPPAAKKPTKMPPTRPAPPVTVTPTPDPPPPAATPPPARLPASDAPATTLSDSGGGGDSTGFSDAGSLGTDTATDSAGTDVGTDSVGSDAGSDVSSDAGSDAGSDGSDGSDAGGDSGF
jgi:hypothetical protein